MADYTVVDASELGRIAASGATILDVRTPAEHDAVRLLAAHELSPVDTLDPKDFMLRRGLDEAAPVYFLCKAGLRARRAAGQFAAAGYKNLYVIEGGIMAVDAAQTTGGGGARAPGGKVTLEGQVRFIAGTVMLAGLFLGLVVKHVFFLVPFLAATGLMFSGATGTCYLETLLLRAPWNKDMAPACSPRKAPDNPTAGGCA